MYLNSTINLIYPPLDLLIKTGATSTMSCLKLYRTLFQQDCCLTDRIYLGCQLLSNVLSIRKKRVYNCSKRFHRSSDWLRYKYLQREVRHQLKSQQRTYFENLSTSSDSTSYIKCFWKYIISRKHDNTGIGSLQSSSGTITDPFKKAELLNEQFQSAFTTSDPHPSHAKDNSLYPIIPEIHITTPGVHKLLYSNKAPGPDGIPAQVLKFASEELVPMLTHLLQQLCYYCSWHPH